MQQGGNPIALPRNPISRAVDLFVPGIGTSRGDWNTRLQAPVSGVHAQISAWRGVSKVGHFLTSEGTFTRVPPRLAFAGDERQRMRDCSSYMLNAV